LIAKRLRVTVAFELSIGLIAWSGRFFQKRDDASVRMEVGGCHE